MITITLKNILSKIEGLTSELNNLICEKLTYTQIGFGMNETHCLFNAEKGVTYTGLIPYVIGILTQYNISYKILDERCKPVANANFNIDSKFEARDYQANIINNASSREVIQAATGAGKTFIMASLIQRFNVKPVVVIAPKVDLAEQIKKEFEKFLGIEIGIVGGGYNIIKDITVCTPMSAPDNLLKSAKMVMYDECHNIPAKNIHATGMKAINAYYRFGVSATPWRDDGTDLLIESILNKRKPQLSINASKLIAKGKLVPCTINFVKFNETYAWPGNYDKLYKMAIVENYKRNELIVNLAIQNYIKGKTCLILIKNIKHGRTIKKIIEKKVSFNNSGEKLVEFISGETNSEDRKNILAATSNGKVKILIGSTIADEGLDVPILDCLILAGGGKSSTRAFQRVGRVLRLYPGKKDAVVYDIMDMTSTLYAHFLTREALYKTEPLWKINYIE